MKSSKCVIGQKGPGCPFPLLLPAPPFPPFPPSLSYPLFCPPFTPFPHSLCPALPFLPFPFPLPLLSLALHFLSSPFPSPLLSCPSFTPFPLPSPFFYPYFTTFTLYPVLPDLFPSSFSLPIPRPYHLCLRLRLHFLNLLVSASPLLPTTIPTLSHFPKFLFFLQFACLLYLFYIFL